MYNTINGPYLPVYQYLLEYMQIYTGIHIFVDCKSRHVKEALRFLGSSLWAASALAGR